MNAQNEPHPDPALHVVATDLYRWVVRAPSARSARLLQITDTHFGNPEPGYAEKDMRTQETIDALLRDVNPEFVLHTGDLVDNDRPGVSWSALEYMNALSLPWFHVLGNHDVGAQKESLSVEEYRGRLRQGVLGCFGEGAEREYAYRVDICRTDVAPPAWTVLCFDSGYAESRKRVSDAQLDWFRRQLDADAGRGVSSPILCMIHIPVIEFELLRESGNFAGRCGEKIWYEDDTGEVFRVLSSTTRVKAIFSGHDHENDYYGDWRGVELIYGGCTGWGGYGECRRGGREIELDLTAGTYKHRAVYPA